MHLKIHINIIFYNIKNVMMIGYSTFYTGIICNIFVNIDFKGCTKI